MLIPDEEKERQEDALFVADFEDREEDSRVSLSQAFTRAYNAHMANRLSISKDMNRARQYDRIIQYIREKTGERLDNPVLIEMNKHAENRIQIEDILGTDLGVGNPDFSERDLWLSKEMNKHAEDHIQIEDILGTDLGVGKREAKVPYGVEAFHQKVEALQASSRLDGAIPNRDQIDEAARKDVIPILEIEQQGVDESWAWAGRTLGGTAAASQDPINMQFGINSLLFGAIAGIGTSAWAGVTAFARNRLLDAGSAMVSEAAIQGHVAPYLEELEIDHDPNKEIISSGFGGVVAGGAKDAAGAVVEKIIKGIGIGGASPSPSAGMADWFPTLPASVNPFGLFGESDEKTDEPGK